MRKRKKDIKNMMTMKSGKKYDMVISQAVMRHIDRAAFALEERV